MTVKSFIKLFIPPIFLKMKQKVFVYKRFKKKDFISTINLIEKKSDVFCVIGNGPSLNATLKKAGNFFDDKDIVAVNHFADTEYYQKIKPSMYLLADPAIFQNEENLADWLREKVLRMRKNIIDNTKWDLSLIVPSSAYGSNFARKIEERNSFIKIFYYNNSDFEDYSNDIERYKYWDKNLIAPPAQTVLNTCLWLGIFLRYEEVYLMGADTSWIHDLRVDQDDNTVYTIDRHFYDEKKIVVYGDVNGKIPMKIHEALACDLNTFKCYYDLSKYAEWAGVKVYNASDYSLIDSFPRRRFNTTGKLSDSFVES